jgi:probable F420-dependent oxidoreductase
MADRRRFRFGVISEVAHVGPGWTDAARRTEDLGYSTLLVRDHFVPDFFGDQLAPLPALMAAACRTERLRLGTLVLDNDYRHPVLLAKEAATLDRLSGGRLELGLGAGWLRTEYERAGMAFDAPGVRVSRLAEAIAVLKGLFAEGPLTLAGEHYRIDGLEGFPKPLQRPHPPLLVGAGSPRMLRLAGREADIVGLLTASTRTGTLLDDPAERLAAAVERKIEWVREGAGSRFADVELSVVATVRPGDRPHRDAESMARERGWAGVTAADVLAMPSVLLGSLDAMAEALAERRERFGLSYYVVSDRARDALAPLVARLAGA